MQSASENKNNRPGYPVPAKLNLSIALTIIVLMLCILYATAHVQEWYYIVLLACAYGFIMNIGYALMHEAVHNVFHTNSVLNQIGGIVLSLFFPIPFHIYRIGHLGHHRRNRSDDEALDLYFEDENPITRFLLWYSLLTGLHWFVLAGLNFIVWLPGLHKIPMRGFDRVYGALFESFNRKYLWACRLEGLAAIGLHASMVYFFNIPILYYVIVLFGFGFMWSTIQYLHHFETSRDVKYGARNVRAFFLIDILWLNFHYHLNHHVHPTVPWLYLPYVCEGEYFKQENIYRLWLRQWKGPQLSKERVENKFAGRVIR